MPLAASTDYPVLNVFWTMFEIFAFVIWFWLLFVILTDVFRSSDLSGSAGRMDHLRDLPPVDRNPHLPDRPWPVDAARALGSASPPAG